LASAFICSDCSGEINHQYAIIALDIIGPFGNVFSLLIEYLAFYSSNCCATRFGGGGHCIDTFAAFLTLFGIEADLGNFAILEIIEIAILRECQVPAQQKKKQYKNWFHLLGFNGRKKYDCLVQ
jgi:hypothetical protein